MDFKKVFRGYDPKQVDAYIAETAQREQQIRAAQKEHIDQLSDENYAIRQQLKQYQTDEQAISKSLVISQHLAEELQNDAQRYSDLVLSRAKIFYATWHAYSQTIVASLDEHQVAAFNALQKKIEAVINAYEGKDVATDQVVLNGQMVADGTKNCATCAHFADSSAQNASQTTSPAEQQNQPTQPQQTADIMPSDATMGAFANPIGKVEAASGHVIDLRELSAPTESLEDICAALGLINKPTK